MYMTYMNNIFEMEYLLGNMFLFFAFH